MPQHHHVIFSLAVLAVLGIGGLAVRSLTQTANGQVGGTCEATGSGHCYYIANSGNDSSDGSFGSPFKTIHKGISVSLPGDFVYVRSGTYQELTGSICFQSGDNADCGTLNITKSGTAANPITYKGYPGDAKPIILGNNYHAYGAVLDDRSYVTLEGFEIRNAFMGVWLAKGDHLTIRNNTIHDIHGNRNGDSNLGGIGLFYPDNNNDISNITIEGNTIYDAWESNNADDVNSGGMWIYSCYTCIIRNNEVYNVPVGIGLKGQVRGIETNNVKVYGNTIHDTRSNAIGVRKQGMYRDIEIYNNIAYNFGTSTDSGPENAGIASLYGDIERHTTENILVHHNTLDGMGVSAGIFYGAWQQNNTQFYSNIIYNSISGSCAPNPSDGMDSDHPMSGFYQQDFAKIVLDNDANGYAFVEDYNLLYRPGDTASSVLYCWDSAKNLAQWKSYWAGKNSTNGQHSLGTNPLFVDAAAHDYRLQAGSPACTGGNGGTQIGAIPCDTSSTDTTIPVIALTAPTNGATISGTISITATASDNVGVAGVQFKLDGANLSAEDTTTPYAVNWNTAVVANGSHVLTAVARDAAGNTATATNVTITVSNPTPDTTAPGQVTNLSAH